MITWLQTFFLKHNKWLFGVLLIVIIVTFVLTIGPQSFFGGPSVQQRERVDFYGFNLSSPNDQQALFNSAEISIILNPELGVSRNQLADYAYLRAAGLGMARDLGIPRPSRAQMEGFIRGKMIFRDFESGEFSAESYNQMLNMLEAGTQFSRESIARVLREDWQIAQVRRMLAGPGVELPFEQKQNFLAQETQFDVVIARVNYDDFRPEMEASHSELYEFYQSNPDRYEERRKIRVTALFFEPDVFHSRVEIPSDSVLQTYFDRNRFIYEAERERPAEGEDPLPPLLLDEVRSRVIADYRSEQAGRAAEAASESFSVKLWEREIARGSDAFQALVEEYGVRKEQLDPFARNRAPAHPRISRQLMDSMWMFSAGQARYFSDIGQLRDGGAVVLVFDEVIPERLPPFEEVMEVVEADWMRENRRRLFSDHGEDLHAELRERMDSGEDFVSAAEAMGLFVESVDTFKGDEVPQRLQRLRAWQVSRNLPAGAVSRMSMETSEGIFIYMRDRVAPEIDYDSEEFLAFVDDYEDFLAQAKGWARLSELADRKMAALVGDDIELDQFF